MCTLDNWDSAIAVCFIKEIEKYSLSRINDVYLFCRKISLSHLTLAKINEDTAGKMATTPGCSSCFKS